MRNLRDSYRCILQNERALKKSSEELIEEIGEIFEGLDIHNVHVGIYSDRITVNTRQSELSSNKIKEIIEIFHEFDVTTGITNSFILFHLVLKK